MNAMPSRSLMTAAVVGALAVAVALQVVRDRVHPRDAIQANRFLYVTSGDVMKTVTLSLKALAADVYWIRAMQHFGGDRLTPGLEHRRYELLYPLLDLTTTLDPYFNIAYRFGAVFLSEPFPGGAGRPDQAVALLRKGLAVQPHKWQYYHDAAFVFYWHLNDYAAAAHWFQRAAAQPNAPDWLAPVAATMLAKGGDRTSSRFLWSQMLTSDQPWLRRNAERALRQLDALDRIDDIEARIRANPLPAGATYSWHELVRRGIVPGVPYDPAFTPFDIDPRTGDVTVAMRSSLFPMPDHQPQPRLPR